MDTPKQNIVIPTPEKAAYLVGYMDSLDRGDEDSADFIYVVRPLLEAIAEGRVLQLRMRREAIDAT